MGLSRCLETGPSPVALCQWPPNNMGGALMAPSTAGETHNKNQNKYQPASVGEVEQVAEQRAGMLDSRSPWALYAPSPAPPWMALEAPSTTHHISGPWHRTPCCRAEQSQT